MFNNAFYLLNPISKSPKIDYNKIKWTKAFTVIVCEHAFCGDFLLKSNSREVSNDLDEY